MPTPYAGNPANFPASVNILAGGDTPSTPNFNTAYEGTLDRTAWLKARSANVGQNWDRAFASTTPPAISSENPVQFLAAVWNPYESQWLVLTSNDDANNDHLRTSAYVTFGLDGGGGFVGSNLFGVNAAPLNAGVTVDPNNHGGYIAAQDSGGTLKAFKFASGTWTLVRTDPGTFFALAPGSGTTCGRFGSYAFYVSLTTTPAVKIASTNDSGASWSDFTHTVAGGVVPGYAIATSGSLALVACTFGQGTITDYFTSPDGVTWTARTFSFLGAHDEITGVVWSPATATFIAAVQTAITAMTPSTKFYSSADGISWTLVAVGPARNIGDLAFLGNTLVCTTRDAATSLGSYLIFSEDFGVTWYHGQASLLSNVSSSANGYVRPTLVAADTQLFHFNTLWGRFSDTSGIPSVAL